MVMSRHNNAKPSPERCPLRNDWRTWTASKREDRLFMSCPACDTYGSHVQLPGERGDNEMTQHYSNPNRESDPNALPDVETFYVTQADCDEDARQNPETGADYTSPGWYWWSCFPGCLPDGEPNGPFDTEAEAVADAQSGAMDDDEEEFESECAECCAAEGFTHTITKTQRMRCTACGYNSHHYPANVHAVDDRVYATAIYSGADDPAGNFPEVEVTDFGLENDAEVLISWCCGAPRDPDPLPPCVLAMRCCCAGHARGNAASEPCDTSEVES